MSPARTALAILLVGLLVSVVFSSGSSLFAQETAATPTYVPYDQLPICPPMILNPTNPTPVADPNGLVCRGPFVFVTETPTPLASPSPTPTATISAEALVPADRPTQNNKLYLPMMQGSAISSAETLAPAERPTQSNKLYLPMMQGPSSSQ